MSNPNQKRLPHLEPRTADNAYYRSPQSSSIGRNFAAFSSRPGTPTGPARPGGNPNQKRLPHLEPKTADDAYYRTQEPAATAQPERAGRGLFSNLLDKGAARPEPTRAAPAATGEPARFFLADPALANSTADAVCDALKGGRTPVLVEAADSRLLMRVRTAVDARVAREIITEDQYRDVRFSVARPAAGLQRDTMALDELVAAVEARTGQELDPELDTAAAPLQESVVVDTPEGLAIQQVELDPPAEEEVEVTLDEVPYAGPSPAEPRGDDDGASRRRRRR